MKRRSHVVLVSLLLCPLLAHASDELCRLITDANEGETQLGTFVIVGTLHHGYSIISPKCPDASAPRISLFSLGHGSRAKTFYSQIANRPSSGFWEIQAEVESAGQVLKLKRVHAYRQLSEKEINMITTTLFSGQEAADIEQALDKAATDAHNARR